MTIALMMLGRELSFLKCQHPTSSHFVVLVGMVLLVEQAKTQTLFDLFQLAIPKPNGATRWSSGRKTRLRNDPASRHAVESFSPALTVRAGLAIRLRFEPRNTRTTRKKNQDGKRKTFRVFGVFRGFRPEPSAVRRGIFVETGRLK